MSDSRPSPSDKATDTDDPVSDLTSDVTDEVAATESPAAASTATDAATADNAEDEESSERTRSSLRQRPVVLAAGAAIFVVALGAAMFAVGRSTAPQSRADTAPIIEAAGAYGAMVANYDANNVDNYLDDMRRAATGNAERQIGCSVATMKQAITTLQLSSRGKVVSSGVIENSGDAAKVLVVIEQTSRWTDAAAPGGSGTENNAANVLTLSMRKVGDSWKVADIASPLAPGLGTSVPGTTNSGCSASSANPVPSTSSAPR
ncbi:hypothetical protein GOEFS_120_00270 [Gordonia effusa NBRC 100432]|uniref:Mce-associated membrane protein n=1 Tax=Gordonia effusa NBRC 100432 TaxID=1077974 RepID=H0R666_9ACTN|nr:hypothetical protein [Gordonia effusa]GAB20567.1 hypothetical protein GOEFS_120_00270 [Gordonia effusa NBRC 100432]